MRAGASIPALCMAFLSALAVAAPLPQGSSSKPGTAGDHATTPTVVVQELLFEGVSQMPIVDQDAIAAEAKSAEHEGPEWLNELAERVRYGWQQRGYFLAVVAKLKYRILRRSIEEMDVSVTVQIDEGEQYRFEEFRWKNLRAFSVAEAEPLFPIVRGEIFNPERIREGLDALRQLYGQRGYLDFTAVPDTLTDGEQGTITLVMEVDEGNPYRIGKVEIVGLDPALTTELKQRLGLVPGDLCDSSKFKDFLLAIEGLVSDDFDIQQNSLSLKVDGTVDIHLEFRREANEMAGVSP